MLVMRVASDRDARSADQADEESANQASNSIQFRVAENHGTEPSQQTSTAPTPGPATLSRPHTELNNEDDTDPTTRPPPYSPRADPPVYSRGPRENEETIQHAPDSTVSPNCKRMPFFVHCDSAAIDFWGGSIAS